MIVLIPARTRRHFLSTLAVAGGGLLYAPGVLAEQLALTPRQTEGPFYPTRLPLDTDNDLIVVNAALTPADGVITHLTGRLLDAGGEPVRNAVVEIWQCDANGVYLHTADSGGKQDKQDKNFQGFGRFVTGKDGGYLFRTIKPVPYPGRAPHIHYAVKMKGREKWTTQCYIKGHPGNEKDGVWRGIRDEKQRAAVTVDFAGLPEAKAGEFAATFDIVMGYTPQI